MPNSPMEIVLARDGVPVASYALPPGQYIIGRDPGCEIPLDDRSISRPHARLTIDDAGAAIEDLGSSQGTFVNGKRIAAVTRLRPGEQVVVGQSISIELRYPESSRPPSGTPPSRPPTEGPGALPRAFSRDRKYDVGGVVAKGGMGAILRAREATTERTVAMKVMLGADDPAYLSRFLLEARITAQLEHPNIVPVHELGLGEDKRVFYTMKMVGGETLKKILKLLADGDAETIRQYPLAELLTIFQKICDAVGFAHSKAVIHRDLKPENVMIGAFGEVLVMDWGLAKILGPQAPEQAPEETMLTLPPGGRESLDAAASNTMSGSVLGTPTYMSPEQARGEVESLDGRTDIYALGGILYQMLALRTAVQGKDANTVVEKVARGEIEILTETEPAKRAHLPGGRMPASLVAVVRRALAFQRDARYSTVAELQAEITAYQHGFATQAEDAGVWKQLWLLVARHKREFAIGIAAWVVIVALAVAFIISLRASEQRALAEKEATRRALAQSEILNADAAYRTGSSIALTRALEACPGDLRDQTWNYLSAQRDSSLGPLKIPGFDAPVCVAAVPGGAGVFALANAQGEIGLLDAAAGRLIRSIKTDHNDLLGLYFSADGRQFAAARSKSKEIDLYDVARGARLNTFSTNGGDVRSVALSRDGSLLAVIARGELLVFDARTGKVRWKRPGTYGSVLIHPDGSRLTLGGSVLNPELLFLGADDGRELGKAAVMPTCQALSRDGKLLAVGAQFGHVYLFDPATGAQLRRARICFQKVSQLSWTADGHLASLGGESQGRYPLRFWSPDLSAPVATFLGLNGEIPWSLQTDSGYILSQESPPRLWRVPVGRELVKIEQISDRGWSASFLSDTVLLARKDYSLARYDLSSPGRAVILPGSFPERFNFGVSSRRSGLMVMSSKLVNKKYFGFKIYAIENNFPVLKLSRPGDDLIANLAFDPGGRRFAVSYRGGGIELFSAESGDSLLKIAGQFARLGFVGDGQHLVAVVPRESDDGVAKNLQLFDLATGQPGASASSRLRVSSLDVSPDRKLIAIYCSDASVHLFDAATLHERSSFRVHDTSRGTVAFHPTLPVIATAAEDGSVKLWDYQTAQQLAYFAGLDGAPEFVSFSPNGRLLAVDGEDSMVRVYDVSDVRP